MFTLNESQSEWLKENFPELAVKPDSIAGRISFTGTYSKDRGEFVHLKEGEIGPIGGILLSGSFPVNIKPSNNKIRVPLLYLPTVESSANRHFRTNGSACFCSPLLEKQYCLPALKIEAYFEALVIPFLYGQLYYTKYKKWPWGELSHNLPGIFESYYVDGNESNIYDCLNIVFALAGNKKAYISSLLSSCKHIPVQMQCACGIKYIPDRPFYCCHHMAFLGMEKLRQDVQRLNITLPKFAIRYDEPQMSNIS